MQELSLHVLDIAENSVAANASLITISVCINSKTKMLSVEITDNGKGMGEETVKKATDPFYTSRTTRRVGLGLSFLKQLAELTDGQFSLSSVLGKGTVVMAYFTLGHVNLLPLGDMAATITTLVQSNPNIDFVYTIMADDDCFTVDTRELRSILGDVSLAEPQVAVFLREYVCEHTNHIQNRSIGI